MAVYYVLTLILGLFLGILWAVVFGVLNFIVVWIIQPITKVAFVFTQVLTSPIRACARASCDPCFQSVGKFLSNMFGQFRLHVTGIKDKEPGMLKEM